MKSELFLGVDGGQSHTEAIVADENGCVLGRGIGGASNHAEQPGGRERLRRAIAGSVGAALGEAAREEKPKSESKTRALSARSVSKFVFKSAHCGMTGGADYKREIIGEIIRAEHLTVGHDAPTALFGATAGKPGIVVIAGTGSVVFGADAAGASARVGGLGYLFSDEGSGFWLAAQTVRLAIREQDGLIKDSGLEKLVLDFFKRRKIREITDDFYNGRMTRDGLASLAKAAHRAAENGNILLQEQIKFGARVLADGVSAAARQLKAADDFPVAGVGGMFRARLMRKYFAEALRAKIPSAKFIEPIFGPAIGALLMAYREAGIETNEKLLLNLEMSAK